jgi:hypothetical protein
VAYTADLEIIHKEVCPGPLLHKFLDEFLKHVSDLYKWTIGISQKMGSKFRILCKSGILEILTERADQELIFWDLSALDFPL